MDLRFLPSWTRKVRKDFRRTRVRMSNVKQTLDTRVDGCLLGPLNLSDSRVMPTIWSENAKKQLRPCSTRIAITHIRLKHTRQLPAQRAQREEKKLAKSLAETINGGICCVVVPFCMVSCIDVAGNNIRSTLTSLHGARGYSCLHKGQMMEQISINRHRADAHAHTQTHCDK